MTQEPSKPFSVEEALRFGWTRTLANLKPLLILGLVGAFLALLNQGLSTPSDNPGIRPLLSFVVQLMQVAMTLAWIRAAIELEDGRPLDLSRPTLFLRGFGAFLLTSILYVLLVGFGLLLLIVPGVIWGLMFGFASYVVVDRELDPLGALKESRRLTNGVKGDLFVFALALLAMNLLGALALGVGLFLTIPTSFIAGAHVLRQLQHRAEARPSEPVGQLSSPTPMPS